MREAGVEYSIIRHGVLRGGGGADPGLGDVFYAMTADEALEASNRRCDAELRDIVLAGDDVRISPVREVLAVVGRPCCVRCVCMYDCVTSLRLVRLLCAECVHSLHGSQNPCRA